MKSGFLKKTMIVGFCIVSVLPGYAQRVKAPKHLSGTAVLENLKKTFEAVNDFRVMIRADVQMERMNIPPMTATMYFKKPNKMTFDSKGFFMVPREGVAFNPDLIAEKYDVVQLVDDTLNGQSLIRLQLLAKDRKAPMQDLTLFVDPTRWTVERMETVPYNGRSMKLDFFYTLEQEQFWLPSKLVVTLGMAGDKTPAENITPQPQQSMPDFQQSAPRTGTVIVQYSEYSVNAGIPDSIFEKKTNGVQR